MRCRLTFLPLLLLFPGIASADAATAPDVMSATPCEAAEFSRFRAHIFAKADAPKSLWHLISNSVCPTYSEAGSAAVKQHIPRPVQYIDKIYDVDGRVIREVRSASPREAAAVISADDLPTYAGLSITRRRHATLEITNFVCNMVVRAALRDGKWVVSEFTTLCE